MKRTISIIVVIAVLLLAVSVWAFNLNPFNFGIVKNGVLYRSAVPDQKFLEETIARYNIKTLVVFEEKLKGFEKRISEERGIIIVHLPFRVDQEPPAEYVETFLKLFDDVARLPVLARCRAGADRTGVMIAIKRIETEGWKVCDAWKEMLYYRNIPLFTPMPVRYLEKRYKTSCSFPPPIQISPEK